MVAQGDDLYSSLAQHLIRYRTAWFVLSIWCCVLAISGLRHIQFDADPERYFNNDNVHLSLLRQQQALYDSSENLILVLNVKEGELFSPANLVFLQALHDAASELPYVIRVDSLFSHQHSVNDDDTLLIRPFIEGFTEFSASRLQQLAIDARSDAAIRNRLVSASGELTALYLTARLPEEDIIRASRELYQAALTLTQTLELQHPNIQLLISGRIVNRAVTDQLAMDETLRLVPLMYGLIFTLLALLLRSLMAALVIAFITTLACLAALGLAMWCGIVLNLLSLTAGNIIITLSIAHCVHILLHFLQMYRTGSNKYAAVHETYRLNLQAITITSVTTAIGFASMNLSAMPPAHDLGSITAIGVMLAFVLSLTVLPFLLLLLPFSRQQAAPAYPDVMAAAANIVIRWYKPLMAACLLLSLLMAGLLPINQINDRFTENIREPHEFRSDNALIDQYFGGLYQIQYSFAAPFGTTVASPQYMQALAQLTTWLREQPEVRSVFSYSDIVRRLHQLISEQESAAIPDDADLLAQYQLLLDMALSTEQSRYYLTPDHSASKLVVALPAMDSQQLINLDKRINAYMQQHLPHDIQAEGTSLTLMWAYLGEEVLLSSLYSTLFALLLISTLLLVLFRSWRFGLISLIPNLLPAIIGYGWWALHSGILDLSQMMVLTLTIGIIVDDTVHFLSKYLQYRRYSNASVEEAIRYTFASAGSALLITTVVLVAGFALLGLSAFVPNANLGLLTAVILVAALLMDLVLLPALLLVLDNNKTARLIN